MEAEIYVQTKDLLVINWSKKGIGFGQLTFTHTKGCNIEIDAECMDINHILEVFKALK